MLLLAGSIVALAAPCSTTATPAELDAELTNAEVAYANLDQDAFVTATDHIALLQPCLGAVVDPALAARWHRVVALKAYGEGDEAGAEAAMRAARALEPTYVFPDDLLPAGPLRALYDAADPAADATKRVPEPREGALAFDGAIGRARPLDRATFVQFLDDEVAPTATIWLSPTSPMPEYAAIPRTRNRLLLGAAIAAGGAAASYGGALATAGAFRSWTPVPGEADPDASLAHLESLRGRANGLFAGSIALGVVAAGGAVGAFAVGNR